MQNINLFLENYLIFFTLAIAILKYKHFKRLKTKNLGFEKMVFINYMVKIILNLEYVSFN